MQRITVVILAAIAAALLHVAFFSALPWPLSVINLPLILVITYIGAFRFRDAFIAAIITGTTIDSLSITPFGIHIAVHLVVTLLMLVLFTRVLTNHSWLGLLGINAAAFGLLHTLLMLVRIARTMTHGVPLFTAFDDTTLVRILIALGVQLCAVLGAMTLTSAGKRAFSRFFFTRYS